MTILGAWTLAAEQCRLDGNSGEFVTEESTDDLRGQTLDWRNARTAQGLTWSRDARTQWQWQ